ncbi:hypothetical protein [Streptomyces sp. NPDC127092]|uniref:hypothetical protein n=1 Tax=Streptomyces sp. NPDC127092 TaxID=3347135 RepID=UPI00364EF3FF
MRGIRRLLSLMAASALLGAGLVAASPANAQAAASDCEGGVNGFTDIPNSQEGRGVGGAGSLVLVHNGAVIATASYGMQAGYINGRELGWGYLKTVTTWAWYGRADVWMDVTNDGGNTWIQCGPFSEFFPGKRITTAAYPTSSSSSRAFRVCASLTGVNDIACTDWW